MRENKALSAWREDQQTIGCWLSLANAYSAEAVANLGFDWVCVDMQHGLIDYTDLVTMLPAISTSQATPIVRVPWNEPYEIMKVLDAGAYGVIVPMVNNREEAQQAVMACRYPPDGFRSFGPIRGALYGGRGYAVEANTQIACIAMIETAEGREKVRLLTTNCIWMGEQQLMQPSCTASGSPNNKQVPEVGHSAPPSGRRKSCSSAKRRPDCSLQYCASTWSGSSKSASA